MLADLCNYPKIGGSTRGHWQCIRHWPPEFISPSTLHPYNLRFTVPSQSETDWFRLSEWSTKHLGEEILTQTLGLTLIMFKKSLCMTRNATWLKIQRLNQFEIWISWSSFEILSRLYDYIQPQFYMSSTVRNLFVLTFSFSTLSWYIF